MDISFSTGLILLSLVQAAVIIWLLGLALRYKGLCAYVCKQQEWSELFTHHHCAKCIDLQKGEYVVLKESSAKNKVKSRLRRRPRVFADTSAS